MTIMELRKKFESEFNRKYYGHCDFSFDYVCWLEQEVVKNLQQAPVRKRICRKHEWWYDHDDPTKKVYCRICNKPG